MDSKQAAANLAEAVHTMLDARALNTDPLAAIEWMTEALDAYDERVAFEAGKSASVAAPGDGMTAKRAAYFLERFKREEKMLGPNEQEALHYATAALEAQGEAVAKAFTAGWDACHDRWSANYVSVADVTEDLAEYIAAAPPIAAAPTESQEPTA